MDSKRDPEAVTELIIHIGAPKTGSTFLQRTAAAHHDALAGHGVFYPQATLRGGGHHDIAFLVYGQYPQWATGQPRSLQELGADLGQDCANWQGTVLLSSENFSLFPAPAALKAFLDQWGLSKGRRTKILFYARRQDELFLSWYNQQVKALGYGGSFEEALPDMKWLGDYHSQACAWAEVFGPQAIELRNYNRARCAEYGLWGDFLSALGLGRDAIEPAKAASGENISLNRDILEIQRVVNQLPISTLEKRAFHKDLMALTAQSSDFFSDAPLISQKLRRALVAEFLPSTQKLAADFCNGTFGFETDDLDTGEAPPYEGLSQDKVLATLAWLLMRRT